MTRRQGHDAFVLPKEQKYLQRHALDAFNGLLFHVRRTADELERLRDDVYDPAVSVGMNTPYGSWVGRALSTTVQGFGNAGPDMQRLANIAGEIDALLEDERREGVNDKRRVVELERLARDVVNAPSSRLAREKLAAALKETS